MILGDTCTRACGFCAVNTGKPTWNDPLEPYRSAMAVKKMNLKHVVITSVNRDDINDDLIFIYEELESYLDEGFVSDPDLSFEIELENVKTRLALDYQKRKLNETAVRLKEEEEHTDKDKNIIASLMLEIVEITENIKNLERSEVN